MLLQDHFIQKIEQQYSHTNFSSKDKKKVTSSLSIYSQIPSVAIIINLISSFNEISVISIIVIKIN